MWHRVSVRLELKDKIREALPSSTIRENEYEVRRYINEYVNGLPESIRSGDQGLVREGTKYVLRKMDQNKKNPKY